MATLSPAWTKFKVREVGDKTIYTWTNPLSRGRYIISTFLLVWLGLWLQGEIRAGRQIINALAEGIIPSILIWFIGWTFGGILCLLIFYSLVRIHKRARLVLSPGLIEYRTGTKPFPISEKDNTGLHNDSCGFIKQICNLLSEAYLYAFGRKYKLEIQQISALDMEYKDNTESLVLKWDKGCIEIGRWLSHPERDQIYAILLKHIKEKVSK